RLALPLVGGGLTWLGAEVARRAFESDVVIGLVSGLLATVIAAALVVRDPAVTAHARDFRGRRRAQGPVPA
ncbi:hypothetical protein, partial [Klebsiella pneumoniae]